MSYLHPYVTNLNTTVAERLQTLDRLSVQLITQRVAHELLDSNLHLVNGCSRVSQVTYLTPLQQQNAPFSTKSMSRLESMFLKSCTGRTEPTSLTPDEIIISMLKFGSPSRFDFFASAP